MKEARRLLAVERPADPPPTGVTGDSVAAQIARLADRAQEILRDREGLSLSLENIRSHIRDQIGDLHDTLQETRQEAVARFDALLDLKRTSETDWPPLVCDTRQAESLIDAAGRDERQLHNSGGTVPQVLKLVRKLIRSYKSVINETEAKEKTNQNDRHNLQQLLDRAGRWQRQLEAYRESHREDVAVAQAVQARLSQVDKAIAKTKRRYRRTPLSYSQAKGVLQELWSLAHDQDLPVKGSDQGIRVKDIEAEAVTLID